MAVSRRCSRPAGTLAAPVSQHAQQVAAQGMGAALDSVHEAAASCADGASRMQAAQLAGLRKVSQPSVACCPGFAALKRSSCDAEHHAAVHRHSAHEHALGTASHFDAARQRASRSGACRALVACCMHELKAGHGGAAHARCFRSAAVVAHSCAKCVGADGGTCGCGRRCIGWRERWLQNACVAVGTGRVSALFVEAS